MGTVVTIIILVAIVAGGVWLVRQRSASQARELGESRPGNAERPSRRALSTRADPESEVGPRFVLPTIGIALLGALLVTDPPSVIRPPMRLRRRRLRHPLL